MRFPVVNFLEWEPTYEQILKDFKWPRENDEKAARLLSKLVGDSTAPPEILEETIRGKSVLVVGPAAPKFSGDFDSVICAGSAASVLRAAKIVPDILVTDLDGDVEDQILLNKLGALAVVHAHGDNVDALRRWAPEFTRGMLATTQAAPLPNVYNFGGFTDGDRSVSIAAHFGAKHIAVTGFDFEHPVGFSKNIEIKKKKLAWAKRILEKFEISYF